MKKVVSITTAVLMMAGTAYAQEIIRERSERSYSTTVDPLPPPPPVERTRSYSSERTVTSDPYALPSESSSYRREERSSTVVPAPAPVERTRSYKSERSTVTSDPYALPSEGSSYRREERSSTVVPVPVPPPVERTHTYRSERSTVTSDPHALPSVQEETAQHLRTREETSRSVVLPPPAPVPSYNTEQRSSTVTTTELDD